MPIDPSIAQNIRPVQIGNPLEQYGQYQQLRAAVSQNRLADLVFGEKQREANETTQINQLYKGALGPDGKLDRNKLLGEAASNGLGSKVPGLLKSFQDLDKGQADVAKTQADTSKLNHETAAHQFEIAGQLASAWAQNPNITQQQIRSGLAAAASSKIISPEIYQAKLAELDGVPADPKSLNQWALGTLQQVMKAKDSMSFIAPDANTVATNTTSTENNKRTVAATIRGQNLTDARAREQLAQGKVPSGYRQNPDGSLVAIPGGPADQNNKAPTEFQGKSAAFGARAEQADKILTGLQVAGPTGFGGLVASDRPGVIKGAVEAVPLIGGGLGSLVNTLPGELGGPNSNQQRAEQAQRDFINAVLRQESGAAIGASEFDNARKQYFPQPGDTAEVIQQKAANRKLAIQGLQNNAGHAAFSAPAAAAPQPTGLPSGWKVEVH